MIRLEDVCRYFDVGDEVVHALDHVTVEIPDGEYVSIMGPSGSGKSTLLNILGLLDTPSSGSYSLDGVNTSTMDDAELAHVRQQKIGFVFQSFHLVPRLSALENVELPMVLAGDQPTARQERGMAALNRVGLGHRDDHRPSQLSGGERQRVAIARAIVMQPTLLLADEPTGNLDSASGKEVVKIMEDLNQQGLTLLVVTHDPAIGERARRQLKFRDGRLAEDSARVA
ncbi:MAG: ABC transporter ATP-binding protein [Chromatiales bacterium]|nr:MAG: ABC transporter ATP-binding protein [Chromatiales bacterium]